MAKAKSKAGQDMMQKLKASLRKGKSKSADPESAEAAPTFKVNVKHVSGLVTPVIEFLKHAHDGVRNRILAWKGERPETLEAMKEEIGKQCGAWLKEEGKRRINPQSIYNYKSDLVACCNGYIAYAGMTAGKRKEFDKHEKSATHYHALIKFLRDTKRGKRIAPKVDPAIARIKSGWKNHKADMKKKAKDMLRYADTDSLLALQDFIEGLIKARKSGNVEKMEARRKAA